MKRIPSCITFCITFCIAFHTAAAEKTYDVTDSKEIQKILVESSCLSMILHGDEPAHPMEAALLAGWHIGKLKVTDDDSKIFMWPVNTHDYRIKRSLEISMLDKEDREKLVLKTKPCGVDPVSPRKAQQTIWLEEEP